MTGSIRTGNYTDNNGNKRYTFEVWAENVEFCESKAEKAQTVQTQQQERPQNTTNKSDVEYIPNDEDLPF